MPQYPGSRYPANPADWSAGGHDPALTGVWSSQYPPAAPFQAPQDGYSGAASQPAISKNLATLTALAATGLAILLIAIIGGINSAIIHSQFNAIVTNLPDDQATTAELDKDSTYGLLYSDDNNAPECSMTSPDGDDIGMKPSSSFTKVKGGKLFSAFSSKKLGAYAVDCNSTAGVSVDEIIAPSPAAAILLLLFGAIGAIIMVVVGLAMGVGGMAWRSKLAVTNTAPVATDKAFNTTAGTTPGALTVYIQEAWQSDQQPQTAQYAQQPQYQQPKSTPQQVPYAASAMGMGAQPQYLQMTPTAQLGWTGQQPAQQPMQQRAQPVQPSTFIQPVQQGQQQAQSGQPGLRRQSGGWSVQQPISGNA